jgi:hypothetical protein
MAQVMTDYWKPYELFIPPELQSQSKAEIRLQQSIQALLARLCQVEMLL